MKIDWRAILLCPFEKIAGGAALLWGVLGLIVSTMISFWAGYHYNGLLHFGIAPNDLLWVYMVEHLVIWLVPALLFLLGGLILSKSKVRVLDVIGTTVFAQIPMIGMNLFHLLPSSQRMLRLDFSSLSIADILEEVLSIKNMLITLLGVMFLVWAMIWMFNALKISCNLKGTKLTLWYILTIIVGDILCLNITSAVTT